MLISLTQSQISLISLILLKAIADSKIVESKKFIQHGSTSVFDHSLNVVFSALRISSFLKIKVDEASLIRGCLFHDYFLYDWHSKTTARPRPHGYLHPKIALENTLKVYNLNSIEQDMIKHHMFPLTICPPKTKEGLILVIADKWCSILETFKANEWFKGKNRFRRIKGYSTFVQNSSL